MEILKIDKIEKYYGNKSSLTKAIDNISFEAVTGIGCREKCLILIFNFNL